MMPLTICNLYTPECSGTLAPVYGALPEWGKVIVWAWVILGIVGLAVMIWSQRGNHGP